jgi:hypothetical protein
MQFCMLQCSCSYVHAATDAGPWQRPGCACKSALRVCSSRPRCERRAGTTALQYHADSTYLADSTSVFVRCNGRRWFSTQSRTSTEPRLTGSETSPRVRRKHSCDALCPGAGPAVTAALVAAPEGFALQPCVQPLQAVSRWLRRPPRMPFPARPALPFTPVCVWQATARTCAAAWRARSPRWTAARVLPILTAGQRARPRSRGCHSLTCRRSTLPLFHCRKWRRSCCR